MTPLYSPNLKVVAVAAVIFALGCGTGAVNYRLERAHLRADLLHDVQRAAVAFDPSGLGELTATRNDVGTPAYNATKRRLQELKDADPDARYLYLFRTAGSPTNVVFLADSTPAGAKDEALPGDVYREAGNSPGLQSIIGNRKPAMEGPLEDNSGRWVTAYAPVRLAGPEGASPKLDILRIDMSANDWNRTLWFAAARGALYTWTLLAFPVFALLVSRRQGEQREAIRNLSEAVEQSHSAIMILDLQHRIEYSNRGVSQQIGYSRRELIGRHWRDFITGPDAAATIADLQATIRTGRSWEGEWTNERKDGTAYPARGMVTPVKRHDDSIACFVAMFDDVSDAKRKEAELRDARDLAQAGDKAKSHFLATMSHEVRTPLNGIVGFTTLLLDTPLNAEQREFVQTIRASGEALIHLTADILDFARIESGKVKLDASACDPREAIEEALDLHATKAAEKGIALLHAAASDVPAAVLVDVGRLRQVLVNLIGNAVKFTERGEVEVRVRTLPGARARAGAATGQPTCTLEFAIRDTGIGIPAEMHHRLFKPFSQLDETSTRRYGGAGLGLAISKNLVHLMGGDIQFESEPGAGTRFIFTITVPVAEPHPPERELDGLKIALAMARGSLRDELANLLTCWGAEVAQGDTPDAIDGRVADLALVEIDQASAEAIVARGENPAGLMPAKTLALVPIALSSELRSALRNHFKLLINLPVHHGPLYAWLSGEKPAPSEPAGPATQFGYRVLVVEDNHVNQRLLQRILKRLGCTSSVVANGREALEMLSRNGDATDIVLLDLHMPEMDGISALEHIRRGDAGPKAQGVWVIALTADARAEQRARAFACGLNDYLTKPLRLPELESAFRRFRSERIDPRV